MRGLTTSRVLPHLLQALCSGEEEVKWRAVVSLGVLAAEVAEQNPERARDIVRRMAWALNEESGNAGWGLPEAMGEILARSEILAPEFAPLLLSYISPGSTYLDFEPLLEGALWAAGRVAEDRPDLLRSLGAENSLIPYLKSANPLLRGLAVRALGLIGHGNALLDNPDLFQDETPIRIYWGEELRTVSITDLARSAVQWQGCSP